MPADTYKRKLTAILSADAVGYSRLMSNDEVATVQRITKYRELIGTRVKEHHGRVIDSPGDNLLAEFPSAFDATRCAIEVQRVLKTKNADLPSDRKMEFRIGIHMGDVLVDGERIYGDGVNISARLESLAEPGGISISGAVYDQIKNKLQLRCENQGKQSVKNIDEPIQVYCVVMELDTIHKEDDEPIRGNKIPIEYDQKDEESMSDSIIDMSVPTDKPSIAVLPFVNMSGDSDQEYFNDGMTEEIITALSKVPDMLVIARNSTFVYKGKAVDVKQVGQELGVRYVLEGSVRKAGNRIRVTAQLIDAQNGDHIWADRYDRDLKDIFELQDEITTRILEELHVKFMPYEKGKMKIKGTNNLEAYLKYWQATIHHHRFNKNDNIIARQLYEEVIELDPYWSVAYAELGYVNINDRRYGWSINPDQCLDEASRLAQKAISIDDTTPQAYTLISLIHIEKGRYDEAIAQAEKAVLLHPNYFSYHQLGEALHEYGLHEKAKDMLETAVRLNPKMLYLKATLGLIYFHLGKYEESIILFKKTLKGSPEWLVIHVSLAASYIMAGKGDDAHKKVLEILRIDPNYSIENFTQALRYKNQTDTDRILNALRKAGLK